MKGNYLQFLPYARTDTQKKYLRLASELGIVKAAKELGKDHTTISKTISLVKKRAVQQGFAPSYDQTHPVPEPQYIKGVSTMYDAEGNVRLQWVKSAMSRPEEEALEEFVGCLMEGIDVPIPKKVKRGTLDKGHSVIYPIPDCHIGMLAYGKETGADYDTKIAVQTIHDSINQLLASTPSTEEAAVCVLGDLLHVSDDKSVTPKSGNSLDVDGRYSKVFRETANMLCGLVEQVSRKHKKVKVKVLPGNHDAVSACAIGVVLESYYRNFDNIEVDTSPAYFHYYEFGANLIGFTHGDGIKALERLPSIMAEDQPEAWARCPYRMWFTGHLHNKTVFEVGSTLIESLRAVTARDAWATERGFRSGRELQGIVLNKDKGETARHKVRIK